MLTRGRTRSIPAEQRIFSRGDVPDGVYAVLDGTIRLGGASRDGRETVLDFYGPSMWFGVVSAFDGAPRCYDAVAHRDTMLLHITQPDLEFLLAASHEVSRAFLFLVSHRLRAVLFSLESYSVQSLEQRLASRLLVLSSRFCLPSFDVVEIDLHLPQEILARLIGSTRQRVNQILREWAADGIVRQQYGRVFLLDVARLRELAQL